ncbi:type II toxin-antitoxin system RelE/ParE family toxin [Porphyrobacter sp. HT-58-2]|uniref:type II toxin-antitoxin system RelE/ParE family toxin n=1 Tax=Porphyrobacter sp. HT-58-2 TaxID=2023229 RepID=UPI001558D39A|nr:type II toxin-antitoxin system RelE/ParE family toxin [Porphyrobacter sp. HT-58-2]
MQDELLALVELLTASGPTLGRPHVDTLAGSMHANMKELRFTADDGVSRAAFAFDPERKAILLVAGDKAGVAQKRFYKALIAKADKRFADHLKELKGK